MRNLYHSSISINALTCVLIDTMRFVLDILFGNHRWTNLLVTISGELFLERAQGVEAGIQGCLYLQLIVDKQIHILADSLLVDDSF